MKPKTEMVNRKPPKGSRSASIGLSVTTLTSDLRKKMGLYLGTRGVLIVNVNSGSPAARAGIRKGMVIEHVGHRTVGSESEFASRVKGKKPGGHFVVGVWRKGSGGKWERANKTVALPD